MLSLTKERFPLLRFILADVPFQNMSLNEQYSDEEQRSSKHENCRHINLIITICANFRKCTLYMTSTNGEIYMSRTIPAPSFLGIL